MQHHLLISIKMEEKYNRNRIYIKPDEQEKIKHFRVLLGGAGIGSSKFAEESN